MINWKQMCKPSEFYGVGIKKMKMMNEALIMKLCWGLFTRYDSFWVQVPKHRYYKNEVLSFECKLEMRASVV